MQTRFTCKVGHSARQISFFKITLTNNSSLNLFASATLGDTIHCPAHIVLYMGSTPEPLRLV